MRDENFIVLVAGYQDYQSAQREFDTVVGLVKGKHVHAQGLILVAKDATGNITVVDTGDHLGRKGAGWGGGVGVVLGLFAPPLLASAVVGGVAGSVVGKFAGHKLRGNIQDKVGEALPPGSAVV